MTIIDRYILTSFLKKFVPAFLIIFFIFVIQTFWLYFDELAGKGLGGWVIFKFFLYFSPMIILNVIPLATLLAGIMTYGSLSEKSEFTAIKSMGVSLIKSMKYTLIFIILIAIGSFIFANTIVPYGNYKFSNLRKKIGLKKPSVAIKQGVFTDMQNFNIYVREKYGKEKNKLKEVVIHQKVNGIPQKTIIAKNGIFRSDSINQLIQLELKNGYFYEELSREEKNNKRRKESPAMKTKFDKHIINIDISSFNNVDFNKSSGSGNPKLNFLEINRKLDTIKKNILQTKKSVSKEIILRNSIKKYSVQLNSDYKNISVILKDTSIVNLGDLEEIYSRAANKAETMKMFAKRKVSQLKNQSHQKNKYTLAFFEKFSFPISIIIMFFVGIPLGAIIKKGGYSYSIVVGIIIFLIYYMLNMFGKNSGEEGKIPPALAPWLSTMVLLPLGIYLTLKANKDGEFKAIRNMIAWINSNVINKILKGNKNLKLS